MDGPLEEKAATLGASNSLPVTLHAGPIFATGELLVKIKLKRLIRNSSERGTGCDPF
jgi:hypothetical protein